MQVSLKNRPALTLPGGFFDHAFTEVSNSGQGQQEHLGIIQLLWNLERDSWQL
jgi:hypothetical protein